LEDVLSVGEAEQRKNKLQTRKQTGTGGAEVLPRDGEAREPVSFSIGRRNGPARVKERQLYTDRKGKQQSRKRS